ncbi:peroxin family protein [Phanerochaete sordida]|uniref:RING-type E3 ubiquitin transferase n=1 Tax=Phanerochaete sordida TaxID=48140 RepID=A0A9P3G4A6_9APHY|nr:peroxin family protein [Phanerochaete sordida]
MSLPSFPYAQQAQIIRSNQRDIFHLSSLREQTEGVLRAWFGTRWLSRWDKEIGLFVKLVYYGLTVGQATQTLGEEYTGIWQHSLQTDAPPSRNLRLILILLPTLPSYVAAKWGSTLPQGSKLSSTLRRIPQVLEILSEINLATFYLRGAYYHLTRRLLRMRYISGTLPNPNARPPSYSLLGILLGVRLLYRLITFLRSLRAEDDPKSAKGRHHADDSHETYVDDTPVSTRLVPYDPDDQPVIPAEEDERTALDVASILPALRAGRNCTLCLEERTSSCATECGHLFCWPCIVGWGREKAECPLCRQSLSITKLLPIYNL